MKITVDKEVFLEKINLSLRFTSSKLSSSTPLQGVCLKGENHKIHFYSTNLNYYYHGFIRCEENHKFNAVIEPKKISEFISLLSSGKINLEIKDRTIVLSQAKTKGEFPLFSAGEFPFPPSISSKKQILKTDFLKETLPLLVFSASTDETRPTLTGVNFVSRDSANHIVTTDGFRLSLLILKKDLPLPSMIVPSSFLSEIVRMIGDRREVFFSYREDEKILAFFIGEDEFFTRLIDGEYPPYEKVVPVEKKTTIVLDREEFLRNIRLVSVFARDFSNIIILNIEKEGLRLSPKTGRDEDNVAFQEAEILGENLKIAFNFKFLIDFLSSVPSKKIVIELLRSDSPAVFKGENLDNFLHIIMPVRVQE